MKKLFAVVIALAMLMSAAAFAEAADFSGMWYLNNMEMEGMTLSAAEFGMEMTFDLKADGTVDAHQARGGESDDKQGTWTAEGDNVTITVEDEPMVFTLTEGNLVADADGIKMILGREKIEGEAFVPGEPKTDAVEADYAGAWKAYKISSEGMYIDAAAMGFDDLTAAVEGTTVTLNGFLFENEVFETALTDGALTYAAEDPESVMISGIKAQLLQDDNMSLTLTASDDLVFIMTRAE